MGEEGEGWSLRGLKASACMANERKMKKMMMEITLKKKTRDWDFMIVCLRYDGSMQGGREGGSGI